MTLVRCRNCATFFDKKLKACTSCGAGTAGVNMALVNARFESNLNMQAEHAVKHG